MAKKEPEKQVQEVIAKEKKTPTGVVKMTHSDGRVAYAHQSMIPAYESSGFKEDK